MTQSESSVKNIDCGHKYWSRQWIQNKPPKVQEYLIKHRPWIPCPKGCVVRVRLPTVANTVAGTDSKLETLVVLDGYYRGFPLNANDTNADTKSNPLHRSYESPVSTDATMISSTRTIPSGSISVQAELEPSPFLSIAVDGFDSTQEIDVDAVPDLELDDDDVDHGYHSAQEEIDQLDMTPDLQLDNDFNDGHASINVNAIVIDESVPEFEFTDFDQPPTNSTTLRNAKAVEQDQSIKDNSSMCNML